MSASRFWGITDSEIKITRGGGAGSSKPKKDKGGKGGKGGGRGGRGGFGGGNSGGGGFSYEAAVVEVINIADHVNQNNFTMTTIGGVPITAFHNITFVGTDIKTVGEGGAGITFGLELSADGGSTWLTTGHYHAHKQARAVRGSLTLDHMRMYNAVDPTEGWSFLSELKCMDQACPTTLISQETSSSVGSPLNLSNITKTSYVVHNAIRIGVHEDVPGTTKLATGTLVVVGYRGHEETTVTQIVGTGQQEAFVTLPEGHTMVDIMTSNVVLSASNLGVQSATGGNEDDGAADYDSHFFAWTTSSMSLNKKFLAFTDGGTQIGFCELWNMNTAGAQICGRGARMAGNGAIVAGMRVATTSRDQVRIYTIDEVATMDSGSIWVVSRKIANTLLMTETFAVDKTDVPVIDLALTPGVIFTAKTLALASAQGIHFETSDDNGATYQSSAQRQIQMYGGGDTVFVNDNEQDLSLRADRSEYAAFAKFTGFGVNTNLIKSAVFTFIGDVSTNQRNGSGYRETKEVINAIQLTAHAVNMTTGFFRVVSYSL